MNIGLDFGSTYSILSTYRDSLGRLEALEDNHSADIPSVVTTYGNKVKIGTYAKGKTGDKNFHTYKAFKMLLMEKNPEFLAERQFDSIHTPQWAAKEFISNLVQNAKQTFKDKSVDNMVVGAPDVWFKKFETLSGRAVIRDICADIDGVESQNVRVVSEPVLASAYFAHNFQKEKNKPFEGNILIIDYGGGTLDLSLTEIKSLQGNSSEIKMLRTNGAGENTDHSVGNAGIIYMERLMEYVIRKNNPGQFEKLKGTPDFYKAVNDLEDELKVAAADIRVDFEDNGVKNLKRLEKLTMGAPISCGDATYVVTYADMVNVYNEVIRPVFEEKMDQMIGWAKELHNIDVFDIHSENFRIALVGGFGKYYLVSRQLKDKFKMADEDMGDMRKDGIPENEQDCERAISYGAALVASGMYSICSTAPYSVGISSRSETTGQESINYMVKYLEEIDLEKANYMKDPYGEDMILSLGGDWADHFVIDFEKNDSNQIKYRAKDKLRKRLQKEINNDAFCAIGVSFDRSNVLSLHIKEFIIDYKTMYQGFSDKETVLELGLFEDVFEEIK